MWKNFKKFEIDEIEFCPYPEFPYAEKKKIYQSYISNWYVNGKVFTSTTAWEPKNLIIFFSKKFEIEFDLYFDLCWRAEIIQVGLNMHLYVDIGDALSSLGGSTSSFWDVANPRWAPIVYRLIDAALIGIVFHYPFLT